MQTIGLPFRVEISNFDEDSVHQSTLDDTVTAIASGKAELLSKRFPNALIITADTNHLFNGQYYGKPNSIDEAREWLKLMRGKPQEIHTALIVTAPSLGRKTVDLIVSTYKLREFSNEELDNYLHQVNPLEKATGYTPDGPGIDLLASFTGEPGSNLALPLETLSKRLREFGVNVGT